MSATRKRRIWPFVAGGVLVCLAAAGAIEWYIRHEVAATGRRAAEMFGAQPVDALVQLVDCEPCGLRRRDRAVWALGQMEDRRALPALRRHLTGRTCDHAHGLCQYELDKAIRKIERTWSVVQRIRL